MYKTIFIHMNKILKYFARIVAYSSVVFMIIILTRLFITGYIMLYDFNRFITGLEWTIVVVAIIVLTVDFFIALNDYDFSMELR